VKLIDFLAQKVTAPGIVTLVLIILSTAFYQWEKAFLLFFLWLAVVVTSSYGKLNTQDTANFCMCILLVNSMLVSNTTWWYAAILAVMFILMNLSIVYNKLFINPYANIVLMIVFMVAGSIITDYVKMQEIDLWFLARLGIWGLGMIFISAIGKNEGEAYNNQSINDIPRK
jgi:hypothetical protein